MKKYGLWIIAGIVIILVVMYNGLVGSRESVRTSWANVETQYQRRADLIPNLVNTVKGSAEFEKSTLEAVMKARANATSIRVDPDNITPEKLAEYQRAQAQVGGAISRLLAVAENYPNLKTTEAFMQLQSQLEGTENRINEARRQFNEAAKSYNTGIAKFPRNLLAGLFGFKREAYFESDPGTEKVPEVKF
jgi:LemA protein